jgi:DNA-binding beta-propeller fold protein YncE
MAARKRIQKRIIVGALAALLATVFFRAAVVAGSVRTEVQPFSVGAVDWLGEFRNATDVQGKGSWWKRFLKAVVGIDDRNKAVLSPSGVAVDSQGRLIVADTRGRTVHIFDPVHNRYQVLRRPATDPFLSPVAVATDAQDRIYVSDSSRSRIFVFSPQGKFLRTLGAIDRTESIFKRSTGIAIDAARQRLYVVDTLAMRVVKMSLEGKVLGHFGERGTGPGQFNYPTFIAVAPDGSLWVTDSLNFRVEHFDADGKFLNTFGSPGSMAGDFDKAKGIAVDREGRVYVVEGFNDRVQVYDPEGRLLFVFGGTGSASGEFFLPMGIALDRQGRIYVADSFNRRVQMFGLNANASLGMREP